MGVASQRQSGASVLPKVIHALLAGHVLDPKLHMTRLLDGGLMPVFKALLHVKRHPSDIVTEKCLRCLACLFLRRVTTDRRDFKAIYGDRAHEISEGALDEQHPSFKPLWALICKLLTHSVAHNCLLVRSEPSSACSHCYIVWPLPHVWCSRHPLAIACVPIPILCSYTDTMATNRFARIPPTLCMDGEMAIKERLCLVVCSRM